MTDGDLPLRQIWLSFQKGENRKKHWRENLSAVATHGKTLFAADDERPEICRLVAEGWGYKHLDTIKVASLVADPLPVRGLATA